MSIAPEQLKNEELNPEHLSDKWLGSSVSERDGQAWDKKKEMDFTYSNIDKFITTSLGENTHFSNALYEGDFSLTLDEAQMRKYEMVVDQLGIKKGSRVLDLGCGWGGWLKYLRDTVGAEAIGVNLSDSQVAACRRAGLEAYIKDARYVKPEDYGLFDAVTAFGSFEHVSSVKVYLDGKQEEVYEDYFKHIYDLLPQGGRFYMQSMTFEKNMIPFDEIDINAPKDSNSYFIALLLKHNPDSWVPYGKEQIVKTASSYFNEVYYTDGRLDYVKTNREWTKLFYKFSWEKYLWFASLIPKLFTDKEFRHQLAVLRVRPNRVCFEREIMGHARLVFEKK
ncbi:cyclopropane-fatty-acyl-phospholipid synthase [Reichenbachiella faecimaris]|uniref:Cyclopropane-fatty-acyl-phospholipid synthase n=1 Tax=Reichenbachiella faecimaris TaxID=692418 RepID=A0A1W2GPK8_REIFA|nr:class I SAM-dependent methyltransferase [Reichenbachiella faecimaris]SMD38595.1 cyclopropane-fatty-acyl-phospholipid synthase [Reichenbachiella faecimaris]